MEIKEIREAAHDYAEAMGSMKIGKKTKSYNLEQILYGYGLYLINRLSIEDRLKVFEKASILDFCKNPERVGRNNYITKAVNVLATTLLEEIFGVSIDKFEK